MRPSSGLRTADHAVSMIATVNSSTNSLILKIFLVEVIVLFHCWQYIATVWGYGQSALSIQVPEVSLGCLSPGAGYVLPSHAPPSSTTTTTTASTSTASVSTQKPTPNNVAIADDSSSGSMTEWKTYGGSFHASSYVLGALVIFMIW
ncbi:uncharacterized protein N7518_001318 [Penicillium psychrosexuale]|uniref:uncharacterized protein n=1 Tax=Penicillium psychrosexuale TaxID=1002107 RepID=UPI002544DF7A|nr:uncharacterized protein N7518_001318 [Penicillium psychrosexuale]KAJ5799250.1 hypothetical protein N7518_001318 [Penicillium psychrosexuale]